MKKLILILIAFGVANIQAMETKYGIGYSNIDLSDNGESIDYDNIELSYHVSFDNNFAAEFSFSTGVKDTTFVAGNDTVKWGGGNSYFLKGIYNINDTFYVSAIYADTELDVETAGVSVSIGDEDFGFGLGANYQIPNSENIIRIGFESYDFGVSTTNTSASVDKLTLTYLF
ncbi:MAG: hypothetical protein CBD82_00945 [Gammaproteobacteria bacterium TMED222]|nr:MAG: hypothetical protein CBD82_00945 [Gammaproteobacteria bacterium TMED222]|tara:strand:- start:196 stop:711 length:516 start_codon:yes stop_codon:yes gene_type:complete